MTRMPSLGGVMAPMVTPMFEDGSPDLAGVAALAARMAACPSVSGLFILGASGEYACFDKAARMDIMTAAAQVDRRGKPFVINVGGLPPEQSVSLSEKARELHFDALAAVASDETGNDPQKVYEAFAPIAGTGLPFMIYWPPTLKISKPSTAIVERLLSYPGFAGLKDSRRDMEVFARLCALFGEELSIIQGVEMLYLPSLALGCAGVIGGGANLYPGKIAAIGQAFHAGQIREAIALQQHLTDCYDRVSATGSVRFIVKNLLKKRGVITGTATRVGESILPDEDTMVWLDGQMEI